MLDSDALADAVENASYAAAARKVLCPVLYHQVQET
jgi:hypothetical protein